MKFLKCIIISFAVLALSISELAAKELKISYFITAPHIIKVVNGVPVGGKVDYFNQYIAPYLGVDIVWNKTEAPIARILKDLKSGKTDAGILFAKRPDRAVYMHFPIEPYIRTTASILVRNDFPLTKIKNLAELKQYKIGYVLKAFIPPPIKKANLNFDFMGGKDTVRRNIFKLLKKRTDALFDPQDITFIYARKKYDVEKDTRILKLPTSEIPVYTAFSKKSVSVEFVKKYEKALKAAQKKMPYRKFLENYQE